jgi:hypothetical protein
VTKRHRGRPSDSEYEEFLVRLIERAKGMTAKGHHLVPAWYLKNWVVGDVLRVTQVPCRKTRISSANAVGLENDYYRVEAPEVDADVVPPLIFEALLGVVEGIAAEASLAIVTGGVDAALSKDARLNLSLFMAFQALRGEDFRRTVKALIAETHRIMATEWNDEAIKETLKAEGTEPTEAAIDEHRRVLDDFANGRLVAVPHQATLVALAGEMAFKVLPYIAGRQWVVYRTSGNLITCDEPVVLVAGPPYTRVDSVGFETAGVVLFPLNPGMLLAMFHPLILLGEAARLDRLSLDEEAEVNLEIASQSRRWLFERPGTQQSRTIRLPQGAGLPRMEGPRKLHVGKRDGDLYRTGNATPWSHSLDPPPWPVRRWWGGLSLEWIGQAEQWVMNQRAFADKDAEFEHVGNSGSHGSHGAGRGRRPKGAARRTRWPQAGA